METKIQAFLKPYLAKIPVNIKPGDTVRVYQKIKDGDKERIQAFEGLVLARKHGKEIGATITVRKIVFGIGVERTFPLYTPIVEKIEIVKKSKVRRAKLYYLRTALSKKLKKKELAEFSAIKEIKPEKNEEETVSA
ncbi:MAG: 50S ribosomal protein L19 [Candidatus Parcubacteria bacterium]|nr:50S ribosomal protein L19 [Candidatus Parcubacteria bacterium]